MGGDDAPGVVVQGTLWALQEAPDDLEVIFFGPREQLRDEIEAFETTQILPLRIVDAPEVIGMHESPAAAVRTKQQSSIHLGLAALKRGEADAFMSAGNTGAVMAASLFTLGRLPGVARPSVLSYFPTTEGSCIVIDVGTNVDCKPEHLVQFAQMGAIYVQKIYHVEEPRVGLLNVGEEPGKGDELAKETYTLLEATPGLHFIGNVEGRDILHHGADVVVCDGFVGNVLLKFAESMSTAVMEMVRQEVGRCQLAPAQQQAVAKVMGGVQRRFNPEDHGGAPLLGVAGNVLIGHGSSSAQTIKRLVQVTAGVARQDVPGAIRAALGS